MFNCVFSCVFQVFCGVMEWLHAMRVSYEDEGVLLAVFECICVCKIVCVMYVLVLYVLVWDLVVRVVFLLGLCL